ncbi:endonuclease/exonuclease/phosphatase family protein [Glycomyces algeriensis]|uniref:Endonuclease n=1 Tax=Glycomyces algeriensis TaxID=256037 RepID=A0A9W6G6C1_9ACTN|nr:endonuclease/exonuclease/phosphatase family protein [Glycomyces algeriensis]MDA1367209.1 endonuclease/exonuclease/phosphatase family protein [Glycomyces algeriensis]MDR7353407.1 endonuclease/exonuclease/phosphatase family metal-dependent hydrolase [Glycomyces algeriensis]GLI41103.1 endonuclease [Glycomyces algeriensis]
MSDTTVTLQHADREDAPAQRRPWYRRRWLRVLSWLGTAGVVAYAAVRLFGLESGFLLVTTVAFVPYFVIAALVGTGIQAAVRHWLAAGVTAAMAVALAIVLVPRAVSDDQPAASGAELTVMSVNLYVGNANFDYIMELVEEHQPDLLSVQELTPGSPDAFTERGLDELMPYSILEPDGLAVGTGLYSRYPLERIDTVGRDAIFYQIAAEVDLPEGTDIRFMAAHPAAPASAERIPLWEEDYEQLPRPDGGLPWVLAGDFNATLDHQNMRELLDSGYTDAAEATGEGLDTTWQPTGGYLNGLIKIPAVTLDHVIAEEGIEVLDWEVLEKAGSDHAPVVARLRLP